MNRRQLLRQLGLGISGGLLLPGVLESCSSKDPGPEVPFNGSVAIIGAGAAGLYAADILHNKGINVTIYEARDQLGGRVRSIRNQSVLQYPNLEKLSSDFPLELGAQWITGTDSVMGKVYQDYRLATVEFPESTYAFALNSKVNLGTELGADPDYNAAKTFRSNLRSYAGSSQSIQQAAVAASLSASSQNLVNGTMGNAWGSNNERIGIGAMAQADALRTTDGKVLVLKSNPMNDALLSRFSAVKSFVNINTPITSINYTTSPITLTAKDGTTFTHEKVIVTVPLSVLKAGGIAFTPALPSVNTSAMSKFGFDPCLRAIIEFKKNFWGDTTGIIFGSANYPEYVSYGMGRSQFNTTLSITVCGPKAEQYSALGDGVIAAILSDLDSLYNGQASLYVRKDINSLENIFVIHDWTKTEYIKGGYSYPLPGTSNSDRTSLAAPVNNVVFFAGEATDHLGDGGNLNGALASAERAAAEVVTAIQKGL